MSVICSQVLSTKPSTYHGCSMHLMQWLEDRERSEGGGHRRLCKGRVDRAVDRSGSCLSPHGSHWLPVVFWHWWELGR